METEGILSRQHEVETNEVERKGKPLNIDRVAYVNMQPIYSLHGYIVDTEGIVYSLLQRYCHGVVCAILFPELAASQGVPVPLEPPEDLDVMMYQDFELKNHDELPVVRIGQRLSGLTSACNT
jgi:hypothetical protein